MSHKKIKLISNVKEARIQRMIASDPDTPEATDEQLRDAKRFTDVFPELARMSDVSAHGTDLSLG